MKNNYYTFINNLKYDSELLNIANDSIKGKGDGRISLNDTKNLLKNIFDKSTVTEVEHRTVYYILKNYKFTNESYDYFLEELQKK